ncbi:MAG: hypothetical protein ACYCYA_11295, partial [Actinomycetes bacterium]
MSVTVAASDRSAGASRPGRGDAATGAGTDPLFALLLAAVAVPPTPAPVVPWGGSGVEGTLPGPSRDQSAPQSQP